MTENTPDKLHFTVLKLETVEMLDVRNGGIYVDATLGLGGHAEAILQANDEVRLMGIDQDGEALRFARERLQPFEGRTTFVSSNFSEIRNVLHEAKAGEVDGIVADLGVSSLQLDSDERGFSSRFDAPLDMRMDASSEGLGAPGRTQRSGDRRHHI